MINIKTTFDFIITGGSLASLVAVAELSKKGKKVALINPGNNWGGHFSPVQFDHLYYDPGMVLYEFDSFSDNTASNLNSYDPWVRNDSGRFCKRAEAFVSQYISSHLIETPKMLVNNKLFDDILISNNLKSLALFDLNDIHCMKDELKIIINNSQQNVLHPSLKLSSKIFKEASYFDASVANHGLTFHEKFIEPFCIKLFNFSSKNIIALYHRVAWLPLFYPETLLSYILGDNMPDLTSYFSYPDKLCSSQLSSLIFSEIKDSQNVSIFKSSQINSLTIKNSRYEILINDDLNLLTSNLIWGLDSSYLLKIFNKAPMKFFYDKSSIGFAFINIQTQDIISSFTILNILDVDFSIYRISNQTKCSGENDIFSKLVIEFNLDYFSSKYGENLSDEDIENKILSELFDMHIISNIDSRDFFISIKKLKNALMSPTRENMHNFISEYNLFCEVDPGIKFIGPSSAFFASSLNDQILQGLKISESII